jgi:hypothetical protein
MKRTILFFFGLLALLTACGGGGEGGNGGSTSSSSLSSSGIVPAVADGAFTLTTIQDDPLACMIAGHTASVGAIDAATRTMVVTDGMGGSHVTCSVAGTSSFAVHGTLDDTGNSGSYFEILIPDIAPGASQGAPASGTLSFSAPWTAGNPYSGSCDFYFTTGTQETVDAGKVWVTFECAAVTSGGSTCPVKIGYAIFENCLTQTAG